MGQRSEDEVRVRLVSFILWCNMKYRPSQAHKWLADIFLSHFSCDLITFTKQPKSDQIIFRQLCPRPDPSAAPSSNVILPWPMWRKQVDSDHMILSTEFIPFNIDHNDQVFTARLVQDSTGSHRFLPPWSPGEIGFHCLSCPVYMWEELLIQICLPISWVMGEMLLTSWNKLASKAYYEIAFCDGLLITILSIVYCDFCHHFIHNHTTTQLSKLNNGRMESAIQVQITSKSLFENKLRKSMSHFLRLTLHLHL